MNTIKQKPITHRIRTIAGLTLLGCLLYALAYLWADFLVHYFYNLAQFFKATL